MMRFFLIIVMLAISSVLSAQIVGIKAGLNVSFMEVEFEHSPMHQIADEYNRKSGFNAGLTMELPVKGVFSVDMGCLISTKGYTFKITDLFGQRLGFINETTGSVNFIYLDIPVKAKACFSAGKAKIYGAFGPYLGLGLGGKEETVRNYGGAISSDHYDNVFENLNKLDCGLVAETGIEIQSFRFSISYSHGLVNISTDNDSVLKNRVLGISLGIKFGTGHKA